MRASNCMATLILLFTVMLGLNRVTSEVATKSIQDFEIHEYGNDDDDKYQNDGSISHPGNRLEHVNISHILDLYVYVDKQAVDNYLKYGADANTINEDIRRDAWFFLQDVKHIHKHDLYMSPRTVTILSFNLFNDTNGQEDGSIASDVAIQAFEGYMSSRYAWFSDHYDMAILFTGFRIVDKTTGKRTRVAANQGCVCDPNALAVIEFDGTHNTLKNTAIGTGLVLGLPEDDLQLEPAFVMGNQSKVNVRFQHSKASVKVLTDVLKRVCLNNLEDRKPNGLHYTFASKSTMDGDQVCRRHMRTTSSFMCKERSYYDSKVPRGNVVCQGIYCYSQHYNTCVPVQPPNSFQCSSFKMCVFGKCRKVDKNEYHTDLPKNSKCLYGNMEARVVDEKYVIDPEYCDKKVDSGRGECYDRIFRLNCCQTCQKGRESPIPGCSYGDYADVCDKLSRKKICPRYANVCCKRCRNGKSSRIFMRAKWNADTKKLRRRLRRKIKSE